MIKKEDPILFHYTPWVFKNTYIVYHILCQNFHIVSMNNDISNTMTVTMGFLLVSMLYSCDVQMQFNERMSQEEFTAIVLTTTSALALSSSFLFPMRITVTYTLSMHSK